MSSRKKNKEKWTKPKTPVGHHQSTNIYIMRIQEGEEKKGQKNTFE